MDAFFKRFNNEKDAAAAVQKLPSHTNASDANEFWTVLNEKNISIEVIYFLDYT